MVGSRDPQEHMGRVFDSDEALAQSIKGRTLLGMPRTSVSEIGGNWKQRLQYSTPE